MPSLDSQLRDYVESTIERVDIDDVAAAASIGQAARSTPTLRRPVWVAAGAALFVILLIGIPLLFIGSGDSTTTDQTPTTLSATTVAPPTTQSVPATTLSPSPDAVDGTGTAAMVAPPVEAMWTLAATVDGGWLTEPVGHNGGFLARHKGLAEGVVEGWINPDEGWGGQLWESTDGVTWVPASDDQEWPPPQTAESMTGPAVIVEYERNQATERVGRLLATSDGSNWREVNLRPYEDNWIPRVAEGGLGWLVYSPPTAQGASWTAPRKSNHGLWYTPDTKAWFEVANLGPLVNYADIGEVGIWDVAMIVREDDILFFAYIAENLGFGNGSQYRTEIWQLLLHAAPSQTGEETTETTVARSAATEAFDFSTQSLCDWFSPEQIDAIVTSTYEAYGVPLDPGDEMDQRRDQNSDCFWAEPLVTLSIRDEDAFAWYGKPFASHPALDDTVRVSIGNPAGSYGLMNGVSALLTVDGHTEQLMFGHSTGTLRDDVETINALGLTIANEMLKAMEWIEPD